MTQPITHQPFDNHLLSIHHRPSIIFTAQVLGDNGKLYVPPELVGVYRSELIPLATVLTPNQVVDGGGET
jgi:hypothetical protein